MAMMTMMSAATASKGRGREIGHAGRHDRDQAFAGSIHRISPED
jgi:hypothetical protein